MRSTTRPGWSRVLVGVAAFALYCATASAVLSRLVTNISAFDTAAATATDAAPHDRLDSYLARSPVRGFGIEPPRIVVAIEVRESPTHSSVVSCETKAERVASEVIAIPPEDFGRVYVNLGCN